MLIAGYGGLEIGRFSQQPPKVALSVYGVLANKARNQQHGQTHAVLASACQGLAGMSSAPEVSHGTRKTTSVVAGGGTSFALSWVHCLLAQQDPDAVTTT